jgi:hypothetical protein
MSVCGPESPDPSPPARHAEIGGAFDAAAAVQRLWAGCERYWRQEEDAVRRYLRERRSKQGDVAWLRLAAYKETRLYRDLPPAQRAAYDRGDAAPGADRSVLDDEMRHYRMICGLIEELGATPPGPAQVLDFPADAELQRLRARLRADPDPVARCVSDLVEGGGGAIYRVLGAVRGSAFDARLAATFSRILDDEMGHGPGQLERLQRLLQGPQDVDRARERLDELGRLRVAMRRQMFGERPLHGG